MHPEGDHSAHLGELLAQHGFTGDETLAWVALEALADPPAVLATALRWRASGIPAADAARWHRAGWHHEQTAPWWLLGFTPAQATVVVERLQSTSDTPAGSEAIESFIRRCVPTILTAEDIVACVATGHLTLDSGPGLAQSITADPLLRATIKSEAALHGVDFEELREEAP